MLQAQGLTKTYGRGDKAVRALDGVTLAARAGELVLVRGPSGCGKTTLLLVLGGLLAPDEGTVEIAGKNPFTLPSLERARLRASQIGFVFQQFYLVPYLSVRDNILCASLGLGGTVDEKQADRLIEGLNLVSRRKHLPGELSTGEKQRVALARAMFNRPPLLLADEPTGNLDEENASAVVASLRKYAEEGGTALMVTHDPRWEAQAHRIIRMEYGRIMNA